MGRQGALPTSGSRNVASHATSSVKVADCGFVISGGTVCPSQLGFDCWRFDGVVLSVPPVSVFPLKQSVGPGSKLLHAMSPLVGFPKNPLFV